MLQHASCWRICHQSPALQVVYDPAAYLAAVKESLAHKRSIEPEQRRLIFTPCSSAAASDSVISGDAAAHNADDLLSELHSWQVRTDKADSCRMASSGGD